jgi:hypothetical protein
MLTDAEEQKLFHMITEIYHHLGLDGQRPFTFNTIKEEAQENILKWKNKRSKKNYVCEKSS